ncbi:MAG: hypothetical protein KC416_08940 [Myxococcales bacterium]|nr:hypothetical protein [Myxococcales bacterium]
MWSVSPLVRVFVALWCAVASGCVTAGSDPPPFEAGIGPGQEGGASSGDATPGGPAGPSCAEESQWIYLLTHVGPSGGVPAKAGFLRFEPDSGTVTMLGTLDCPGTAGPFSMAVDRSGHAWALFVDGRIYRIRLADLQCEQTAYDSEWQKVGQFGMAYASESSGSPKEELFVAGTGREDSMYKVPHLGSLDTETFGIDVKGPLPVYGELTGNGLGEVWLFSGSATPYVVHELDKTTGASLRTFDVGAIDPMLPSFGSGYAFAFWGGDYYIFFRSSNAVDQDPNATSNIWKLDPETGDVTLVKASIGHIVVGAGVSTCAPTTVL